AGFMVPHPPMIVPDIGRGSEAQISETIKAYEKVASEIAAIEPETIIITSPHSVMYLDYFHISPGKGAAGSFASFRASGVKFSERYDEELVYEITKHADAEKIPAGTLGERDARLDHGTMVPLWFIRNRYKGGKIVRIGLSGLPLIDHYRLGMIIRDAVNNIGRRAVIVASGDLSHKLQEYGPYGYAPEGPEYDKRIMDVMSRAAFSELFDFDSTFCEKAAECGHRSFVIMAGAFDGMSVRAEKLSYQDITGVGYGICTFYPDGYDESRRFLDRRLAEVEEELRLKRDKSDAYVRLARNAIEAYVLRRERISVPDGLPEEMLTRKAGVFVSIHKHDSLRGCIGTISPTRSCVAEEIITNAISAATKDPRFPAILPDELGWLEISVDVLGEPEDIESKDELDVKKYGVIVSSGLKKGL
ncbi:MAG TPA: AmmeMemoRadiSam system protein A, partial [Bacillota bacterium]|nr:AmmeMemoRadiSam system protein A [Bacillota bacterium]